MQWQDQRLQAALMMTEDITKLTKPRSSITHVVDVYHYFRFQPNE
ncbi:MAG: hypothetical protein ACO1OO_13400 [Flavisolibacter sp.]